MRRTVELPLLHDHHSHTSLYAALGACPDLSSLDRAAAMSLLEALPADRLSVVRGWRTSTLPPEALDTASLPPLLLVNWSLHGYLVSDAAIPFVADSAPDIVEHRLDTAWREANIPRLFAAYCDLAGFDAAALDAFLGALEAAGTGSIEDMAVTSPAAIAALAGRSDRLPAWTSVDAYRNFDEEIRRKVRGIKLFLDGSIGARTAALSGGWPGGEGRLLVLTDGELDESLGLAAGWRLPVAIHAIGEDAIVQALDALERARTSASMPTFVRLEHVQFIDPAMARRARDLGVTLSMQPNFTEDSEAYADRLSPDRLRTNNPFRMLIDKVGFTPGRDLVFGSDGMPHGIAGAARWSLFPPYPGQRLSLEELVAGYGPSRGPSGSFRLVVDEDARDCLVEA